MPKSETILLSKPKCVQCTATERRLTSNGTPFTIIDMTQDEAMFNAAKENGFQQAPVVLPYGKWEDAFSGFQPDALDELIAR